MKFWYGSGYADSHLQLMDPDPDPTIFVSDLQLQERQQKIWFFCLLLFEGTFTSFFKIKKS
jgi:hypothetical protein